MEKYWPAFGDNLAICHDYWLRVYTIPIFAFYFAHIFQIFLGQQCNHVMPTE